MSLNLIKCNVMIRNIDKPQQLCVSGQCWFQLKNLNVHALQLLTANQPVEVTSVWCGC